MTVFANVLSGPSTCSGAFLVTPEDNTHAWCAVARPLLLRARVLPVTSGSPDEKPVAWESLRPLVPLIFERLLGRPLDLTPWGVPAIKVLSSDRNDRESLGTMVVVALAARPPMKSGLFEVSTPLGPVSLRLEGLQDSLVSVAPECCYDTLVVDLPVDWLDEDLVDYALDQQCIEVVGTLEEGIKPLSGAAWHAWLAQWGCVDKLQVSMHMDIGGDQTRRTATLAATFVSTVAQQRCATALSSDRLLVMRNPPRATFAAVRSMSLEEFQERAEHAWKEHVILSQEIARIDGAIILHDATIAVPANAELCFRPLLSLLQRWLDSGTLRATSTICAQKNLQDHNISDEAFRKSCWHGAFRIMMQIRSVEDCSYMLVLALLDHWKNAHGICLDLDSIELSELVDVLQEVWLRHDLAAKEQLQAAETEAAQAESALLEELEAEAELGKVRESKRREKKLHQKMRQQRKDKTNRMDSVLSDISPESSLGASIPNGRPEIAGMSCGAIPSSATGVSECTAEQGLQVLDGSCAREVATHVLSQLYRTLARPSNSMSVRSGMVAMSTKSGESRRASHKREKGSRHSVCDEHEVAKERRPSPVRRPADLDFILEAVRKSNEMHSRSLSRSFASANASEGVRSNEFRGTDPDNAAASCLTASESPKLLQLAQKDSSCTDPASMQGHVALQSNVDKGPNSLAASDTTTSPEVDLSEEVSEVASSHEGVTPLQTIPQNTPIPTQGAPEAAAEVESTTLSQQVNYVDDSAIGHKGHAGQTRELQSRECPSASTVSDVQEGTMLATPSSTAAFMGHGDPEIREAPQPLEDATDSEEPQQGFLLSPASTQSKSARRSHRRRRRIAQHKAAANSDASTQPSSSGTPQSTAEADVLTGANEASRGGNATDSSQKLRRRNVVTLSDLGLDLMVPTHEVVSPSMPQAAAPLAVCPGSLASPSHTSGGSWVVQATSDPANYSQVGWQLSGNSPHTAPAAWASALESQQQRIMGTYPTAGPCPLSVAAAGEASQRSPVVTPMVSPTARPHGSHHTEPLLASWLHANGMQSSGADLAEQLRAVAPESYED